MDPDLILSYDLILYFGRNVIYGLLNLLKVQLQVQQCARDVTWSVLGPKESFKIFRLSAAYHDR